MNLSNQQQRFIYNELNSFRWPDCLPLKPDDWIESAPYVDDGRTGMAKYHEWKETEGGKVAIGIMAVIKIHLNLV